MAPLVFYQLIFPRSAGDALHGGGVSVLRGSSRDGKSGTTVLPLRPLNRLVV